jgi:ankyrin repeat protein
MVAALNGHLEVAKKLRTRGADVNNAGLDQRSSTLPRRATTTLVRYLLAEGADLNAASPNGHDGADDGSARRAGIDGRTFDRARAPTSIAATRTMRARSIGRSGAKTQH